MTPSVVPAVLDGWMQPFRGQFTAAIWRHGWYWSAVPCWRQDDGR